MGSNLKHVLDIFSTPLMKHRPPPPIFPLPPSFMSERFLTNFMADLPHQGGYVSAQNQLGKKVPLANTTCLIEECQNRSRISVFLPWRLRHIQNLTSLVLLQCSKSR